MSLLRAMTLLAALLLVAGCGRKPTCPVSSKKPTPAKPAAPLPSADEKALQQLGQNVFTAFVNGDSAKFQSHTVAALAAPELETALRTVRKKESRQFIARLEAIPPDKRNALQLDTLRLSKAFLANPKTAFANEWLELQTIISELGKTQLQFFNNLTSTNAPLDWARASKPSTVIDINPQSDATLPEARVDLVFSAAGKSYRLQLSNCNKLPGHGWRIAENLRFIDLTAEAAAEKDWGDDLPAALKQAQAEGKRVLINFTASDWHPDCIALHDRVLTQPVFRDWAAQKLVLVRADFPRHTSPPQAQADANKLLVHKYAVQGFPTLLLLDAAGKELHRIEGYENEDSLVWVGALKKKLNPENE
jgi:thioredoxin-related protein/predicted small lipoprotein YifL